MSSFNRRILTGTLWSILGQGGTLSIGLVANIILARVLTPYEFGQIGIIMFFIILANVFAESGLGGALVRKMEVTKEDYATAFTFNFIFSLFCFILLVLFSGEVADYYKDKAIQNILIVSGIILIINNFQFIQNIDMMRGMKYKNIAKYRFIGVLLSSSIGVFLAFYEFGVWSLVIMQLLSATFTTILICFYEGIFFSFAFNKKSFKELYAFGINTTLASLLNTVFENIYQLILGRYFSINHVGLFYQAKKLQEVPIGIINMTTQSVIFSSLSKLQDEKAVFIKTYNKIVLLLTVIVGAITAFIYLYSENIIMLLYGIKWIDSVFYMKLLSIASFFYMQEMFNRVIFKVFNQTQKILYLEILKKSIQMITIVIGVVMLDLKVLLFGFVITSIVSYFINFFYSRKILGNISFYELVVVFKVILSAILTIGCINLLVSFFEFKGLYFLISIPIFLLLYLFMVQKIGVINIKDEYLVMINMLRNNKI